MKNREQLEQEIRSKDRNNKLDVVLEVLIDIRDLLQTPAAMNVSEGTSFSCPPHSFMPYQIFGGWGSTAHPPNVKCTKCGFLDYIGFPNAQTQTTT